MLLDSASLYFRAFFGVPDQRTTAGRAADERPAGLPRHDRDARHRHRPTHLVACWDDDWRPQWRVDLVPTYKTHRLDRGLRRRRGEPRRPHPPGAAHPRRPARHRHPPARRARLRGRRRHRHPHRAAPRRHAGRRRHRRPRPAPARRRRVRHPGALHRQGRGARPRRRHPVATSHERYAVATGEAYLDMSVLRGDTSDGLPGVKGIGDKTAAQLIETYGSLAGAARGRRRRRPRAQGGAARQPRGGIRLPRRRPDRGAGRARRPAWPTSTSRCPTRSPTPSCSSSSATRTASRTRSAGSSRPSASPPDPTSCDVRTVLAGPAARTAARSHDVRESGCRSVEAVGGDDAAQHGIHRACGPCGAARRRSPPWPPGRAGRRAACTGARSHRRPCPARAARHPAARRTPSGAPSTPCRRRASTSTAGRARPRGPRSRTRAATMPGQRLGDVVVGHPR